MKIAIWITAIFALLLFILGMTHYAMIDTVANPLPFVITFVIIFIALILIVINSFSKKKN